MASRGLGSLTLDLIAKIGGFTEPLGKAERELDRRSRAMESRASSLKKVVAGAFAGLAAGIAGAGIGAAVGEFTRGITQAAKDAERFAALSNTNAQTFQGLAAGAARVGIEQEKLADIFKDTQDKVGDYIANGGGELKDFFDNIGKQAGVTAEQFRKLSGPDALQLYFSTLDKAGISQSEMVFYMEAIADEASALIPLLRDNGAGFRSAADEASRYGAILDADTIAAAKALTGELRSLELSFDGLRNQIASESLPVMTDTARAFRQLVAEGDLARNMATLLSAALQSGVAVIEGYNNAVDRTSIGMEVLTKSAAGAWEVLKNFGPQGALLDGSVAGGYKKIQQAYADGQKDLDALIKRQTQSQSDTLVDAALARSKQQWNGSAGSSLRPLRPIKSAGAGTRKSGRSGGGGGKSDEQRDAEALRREVDQMNASLDRQIALYGDVSEEARVRYEIEHGGLQKATQAEKDGFILRAKVLDQKRDEVEFEKQLSDIQSDRDRVDLMIGDMQRELTLLTGTNAERIHEIALRTAGKNATDEQVAAIERLVAAQEQAARVSQMWDQAERTVSDTVADLALHFGDAEKTIKSFFDSIAQQIAQFIADEWARKLTDSLKGFVSGNTGSSGSAGWIAGILSAFGFGGGRAGGGPVQPGQLYEVNEHRPEMLSINGRDFLMMGAAGGRVSPRMAGGNRGGTVIQHFYIPGTPNRRTPDQVARKAGQAATRATARNG